jgi:hypothetical protein
MLAKMRITYQLLGWFVVCRKQRNASAGKRSRGQASTLPQLQQSRTAQRRTCTRSALGSYRSGGPASLITIEIHQINSKFIINHFHNPALLLAGCSIASKRGSMGPEAKEWRTSSIENELELEP